MKSDPVVSICIPTYNQPARTRRLLESIRMQTFTDYEVVITDDTHDESVHQVVQEYVSILPIRYSKNVSAKGSPDNWNEAVKNARGSYIKMMHHDDWFATETSLQKFVDLLSAGTEISFAFSGYQTVVGNTVASSRAMSWVNVFLLRLSGKSLFGRNSVGAPSTTIYRNARDVFFDSHLRWTVDVDFYISYLLRHKSFKYSRQPLVCVTDQAPHQITAGCLHNPEVELFEWPYTFNKFYEYTTVAFAVYAAPFFLYLFRKHRVTKLEQLSVGKLKRATRYYFRSLIYINNALLFLWPK